MAVGLPLKTTYADGDVYSASDVNDTNGTINAYLAPSLGFAAGKNKIINGDFRINQRAFTSNTTNNTYNFDRWIQVNGGTTGTLTVTPQTFTPGAAPVAGYEGFTFVQCVTASGASINTYAIIQQRLEDVRTLAEQTATISFWAKAASGTPKIGVETEQYFGTGGSPSSAVTTAAGTATLSTSWARYSVTVSVPSISGKTIGTDRNSSFIGINLWMSAGSDFASRASSIGLQNATFQIWGVQVEQGSTATAFQTATGTIQGELAACQRYYYRQTGNSTYPYAPFGLGYGESATDAKIFVNTKSTLRTFPSSVDFANLSINDGGGAYQPVTVLTINQASADFVQLTATATGMTANRPTCIIATNSSTAYLGFSAEL